MNKLIINFFKNLFTEKSHIKTEAQLNNMSKDALEIYARTLGVELDKRHNKSTLVKQVLDAQKYFE
jgi:hypothetical protein